MNGYFYIALLLLALILLPYLRIFGKRLVFWCKLRHICQKRNFSYHGTHFGWLFSPWWYPHADLIVEGEHYRYSVKLFASKSKTRRLTFTTDGRFYWVKKMALTGRIPQMAILEVPEKPHKLPSYDFAVNESSMWDTALAQPILLVHPICHEFRRENLAKRQTELLGSWDDIGGGICACSASRFFDHLETYEHQKYLYR